MQRQKSHSKQENSVRLFQNTSIDLCRTPSGLLRNVDNMWSHKIEWKTQINPYKEPKEAHLNSQLSAGDLFYFVVQVLKFPLMS